MKEPISVRAADCFASASAGPSATRQESSSILDARSPAEFAEDHVPGAINWPVLNDAQRIQVGTLHREHGAFAARRTGAALVARNIAALLDAHAHALDQHARLLVYCWRGGQRSAALATVLARIGYRVAVLEGGYKSFRCHVREQLPALAQQLRFRVIAGRTGSGKTALLAHLARYGQQILDLELLACHRGSVLGAQPGNPQPGQRAFETRLWHALSLLKHGEVVWLEAESKRIGLCTLPEALVEAMRRSPCVMLTVPVQARTDFLLAEYPFWVDNPQALQAALQRLLPLVGTHVHGELRTLLAAGDIRGLVRCLLERHYDPLYDRSLEKNYRNTVSEDLHLDQLDATTLAGVAAQLSTWEG